MRLKLIATIAAFVPALVAHAAMRPTPEYLKSAVVYQIILRNFTRDGTFAAATEMLEHVRSVGVDVVYVSPFVEMDRDPDVSKWSPRQRKSGFVTPKNLYRISNYDRIDPEYGTDEDFSRFNAKAHALGMKVYMDLVYLHCGPNNVLKDMFSDAFQRNPDGTVRTTEWNFPFVNFASKGVRTYLIDSMLHWMRLGVDGFRCDVGDQVPIDFWVEAVRRCQIVNPDLVMINEGTDPEWLEKAFDACYAWPFSFGVRKFLEPRSESYSHVPTNTLPAILNRAREYEAKIPKASLLFCFMDNHDTAADDWEYRFDRTLPVEAGNAAFTVMFLRRGLPLVFSGNEIADNSLNTFFAAVEDIGRASKTVDWARAIQPAGQKRLAHIRRLAELRHTDNIFAEGDMDFVTDGEKDGVIAFTRTLGGRTVFVAANLTGREVRTVFSTSLRGKTIYGDGTEENGTTSVFRPWGFVVREIKAGRRNASFADFNARASAGEKLTVAFFGGSLTWSANASDPNVTGFRGLMAKYLVEKYPLAHFTFVDAAIGGTGSNLGMFRLERDVLSKKPDLVFLDFACNDGGENTAVAPTCCYEYLLRGMIGRGIPVQQMFFTFRDWSKPGAVPSAVHPRRDVYWQLAKAYGTPVGDVYEMPLWKQLNAGEVPVDKVWPIDGGHPDDIGYQMFADAGIAGFEKAIREGAVCRVPEKPVFGTVKDLRRWNPVDGALPKGWVRTLTYRTSLWYDGLSSRWMEDVAAFAGMDRSALSVEAPGNFFGIFGEADERALIAEITADGKKVASFNGYHRAGSGRLFIWRNVLLDGWENGVSRRHVFTVDPIPSADGKGEFRVGSVCTATVVPVDRVVDVENASADALEKLDHERGK